MAANNQRGVDMVKFPQHKKPIPRFRQETNFEYVCRTHPQQSTLMKVLESENISPRPEERTTIRVEERPDFHIHYGSRV